MTNTKPKPIFKKRMRRGIASAVFENTLDGISIPNVNLQRSYRKNGEWKQQTIYLDHEDIPFMIECLNATWEFMNQRNDEPNTQSETIAL